MDIKFEIDNSTLALLGPSGCGKSMTLKCIAGIESPDEGEIILNGKTLFNSKKKINIAPQYRKVGLLFQSYALFPNMNLKENIIMGIPKHKYNKEKIAQEVIRDFSLQGLEKNYPHQLSGGQQQRVALARMIVNEPEILMLDEPFSALDEYLKWQIERELMDIISKHRGEIIYVSHNKDEVFRISDTIAVINNGSIEEIDDKSNLFKHPKSIFSATLAGYKNISRAKKIDNHRILAIDWDIELKCKDVRDDIKYISIQEQNIHISHDIKVTNTFKLHVVDIVENINSNIYILSNNKRSNSHIYMEMSKKNQDYLKDMEYIYAKFDEDNILQFY